MAKKKHFTILVVPQETGAVKRYQLSPFFIKFGFFSLICLSLSYFILLYAYFSMYTNKVKMQDTLEKLYLTNSRLSNDHEQSSRQVEQIKNKFEVFSQQVVELLGSNERIRKLIGLTEKHNTVELASDADQQNNPERLSMGGTEDTPEAYMDLQGVENENIEFLSGLNEAPFNEDSPDLTPLEEDNSDIFVNELNQVSYNTSQLMLQFEELEQFLSEQQSIIESRPSIAPVSGWISSGFGSRRSPFTKTKAVHYGIDIAAPRGTTVVASANGIISKVEYHKSYGRIIYLNHGNGIESRYCHLDKILVKQGQRIKKYQQIGKVGSTGRSTGPHLHYEVRIDGVPVNPMRYITE